MPNAGLSFRANALLPPPPHDPRERIIVSRAGAWEVRAFAETDPKFDYLIRHGMWHLQLWHPGERVSILTASALTAGCYELFPVRRRTARVGSRQEVVALIAGRPGLVAPSVGTLAVLEAWFVEETVVRWCGHDAGAARVPSTPKERT